MLILKIVTILTALCCDEVQELRFKTEKILEFTTLSDNALGLNFGPYEEELVVSDEIEYGSDSFSLSSDRFF